MEVQEMAISPTELLTAARTDPGDLGSAHRDPAWQIKQTRTLIDAEMSDV
jgi:hypothetical protein